MCGLRTRPRTDVDPPRFLDRTSVGGGHIVSPPPARYLVSAAVSTVCVGNGDADDPTDRSDGQSGPLLDLPHHRYLPGGH